MSGAWPVRWYDELDSTNEEARRLAAKGEQGPVWLAARRQTAGRGRLGRAWKSPAGNLFCTALFAEPGGLEIATKIPFAAALAVSDTILSFAPEARPGLKWPNDVLVDGAKLSGILVESLGEGPGGLVVAAGIGINVASSPAGVGQPTTCLADLAVGPAPAVELVMTELAERFAARCTQLRAGFATIRSDWLARAAALGQKVRAAPGGEVVEGIFEGMGEDGSAILRLPDGRTRPIRAGDVYLIGRAEGDAARD